MYGIVLCSSCGRKRIADLKCGTSVCPYCGRTDSVNRMTVLFSDISQNTVRKVFSDADSSKYPAERKKDKKDPDPLSTIVYGYEHASGIGKLTVIAKGLTDIKGEFTKNDIEELLPGEGERLLKQMISADIVIEVQCGRYRYV